MLVFATGGILIVADAIAALTPKELYKGDGTKIMLLSGDFVDTDESMQNILAKTQGTLRMIETGQHLVVVDAIAALSPMEFDEGIKIMLLSGDSVDTSESIPAILTKMQDVLRKQP